MLTTFFYKGVCSYLVNMDQLITSRTELMPSEVYNQEIEMFLEDPTSALQITQDKLKGPFKANFLLMILLLFLGCIASVFSLLRADGDC